MDEKEPEARPLMGTIFLVGRAKRAPHWGVQSRFRVIYILYIGECGSTLYVGLSRIVRNLIQKSTGWDHTFLSIFFFFLRDEQGWRQY